MESLESLQSLIFTFLIRKLYRSEDDILKLPFHIIRFRLNQLRDYDQKVEEHQRQESEKMKSSQKRR